MHVRPAFEDRNGWDGLFGQGGPPFQQSWSYGAAATACGAMVERVVTEEGTPVQCLSRRFGPARLTLAFRAPACARTLGELARGRAFFAATPDADGDLGPGFLRLASARTEAVLDLDPPENELRSALRPNWRNHLRQAEAKGTTVRVTTPSFGDLAPLLARDMLQQADRGYRALPSRFLAAWLKAAPDAALFATATGFGGHCFASVLILVHGSQASWHCGWADAQGRRAQAHTLLLWRAALVLKGRGVRKLNLGIADPLRTPGLAAFKAGTGAALRRPGATVLVLPSIRRRS